MLIGELCIYGIGCLYGWRVAFRWFWRDIDGDDGDDVITCVFFASTMCWFWPSIPFIWLCRTVFGGGSWKEAGDRIAGSTRQEKRSARAKQFRELELRNARLEIELGIAKSTMREPPYGN